MSEIPTGLPAVAQLLAVELKLSVACHLPQSCISCRLSFGDSEWPMYCHHGACNAFDSLIIHTIQYVDRFPRKSAINDTIISVLSSAIKLTIALIYVSMLSAGTKAAGCVIETSLICKRRHVRRGQYQSTALLAYSKLKYL